MATPQLIASSMKLSVRNSASLEGIRPSVVKFSSFGASKPGSLTKRSFNGLVVKAAAIVAPKYVSFKPLGDRVLARRRLRVRFCFQQQLNQSLREVKWLPLNGAKVIYSKYAGTEVEFNDLNHLILKEDDIVGILGADDIKDLKPLNDRVFIKENEMKQVLAVGPGTLNEEGNRKPLSVACILNTQGMTSKAMMELITLLSEHQM
ncbi:Chaperonin 20 isoform 2 [Hibiscus syriacus]|uniref:Chaperonin 20 isoform 2 n=1 Tax=Hibiscus syriacus TaxID=106335 RepID=A0A6A2WM66_HIBSY|nr:Chaperonin 20 isoform 2 [Hibiscus syriacus]